MTEIFKMPDIGEGMAEGDIASWLVKVGDKVSADDPVAEIQNDKLVQEILSPYSGTVTKIFAEVGETVFVGNPLIEFDGEDKNDSDENDLSDTTANDVAVEKKPTESIKEVVLSTTNVDANDKQNKVLENQDQNVQTVPVVNNRVLAMPSVRHFAFEKGIDLSKVQASGRHGHVTISDVEKYLLNDSQISNNNNLSNTVTKEKDNNLDVSIKQKTEQLTTTSNNSLDNQNKKTETIQSMTPVRKAIAKAMTQQNSTIPLVTNFDSVEVSKLVEYRQNFKQQLLDDDIHLTYLSYAVKALAATAKKFPELNASIDMEKQEITYHNDVNMGIAVNAPSGLYVPVIKNADQKSIITIAKEITELSTEVRNGTIRMDQMQGGTITISNLGSARGTWFTPIINGKEVAILGLGSIIKEPIVNSDNEISIGQNMKLSLSYDHRLIDGMLGQTAINYLKKLLADPAYMLMEV
ncbi:MAG: 2-oxo acid dehydrogenase subunit E2 [Lactobacillaceae bacterium]|jgi:pyruvate dehydrogenase E2 component (dihydrolipoamide acetyltransferase)|nr:2-oxo acid dehydrogenase subunit E2 [Lactobacillaceae bacterium]